MATESIIIKTNSANPNDPHGPERRNALLKRNRELCEHDASLHQNEDVMYIITDEERHPTPIPSAQEVKKIIEDGCIPTSIMRVQRWQGYKFLREYQRRLHQNDPIEPKVSTVVENLSQPAPTGHFFVIVISGGKQLAAFPRI